MNGEQQAAAVDLRSIVLRLSPLRSGAVHATGRVALAAILQHVARQDAPLAAHLHDSPGLKPFTCSGILEGSAQAESMTVAAGQFYHIRLTGLTTDVCRAWECHFLDNGPRRLQMQSCEFAVTAAISDPRQHSWAGQATYGDLLGRALAQAPQAASPISLELATPVAFRTHGMNMPLPLPSLLFGSLLERWNTFSPYTIPLDLRSIAEGEVAISSFTLESAAAAGKDSSLQIGGYGRIKYRYLGNDQQVARALHMLADYARYSGVGMKTTMGMGQCRRLSSI
jgi:CRISPR-associated endoribonuclease Cas6